jgi:protein-arginine kinase activator protein McsA
MRCTKCHKNEATFHFTPVLHGKPQNALHFCKDCTSAITGFHIREPEKPEAWPVTGKKRCTFCGRPARVGNTLTGSVRYWCSDCTSELWSIFSELCASERPRLKERVEGTLISTARKLVRARHSGIVDKRIAATVLRDAPEVAVWVEAVCLRATKIFVDRRRQHGRDKGS